MASWSTALRIKTFKAGDIIFRQGGASSGEAYMIQEGTVQVRKDQEGQQRVLRTLRKGDLLGEVALFRAAPHSATAVAVEPAALLVIPVDRLEQMVRTNPGLAIALIRQLARMAAGDSAEGGSESPS